MEEDRAMEGSWPWSQQGHWQPPGHPSVAGPCLCGAGTPGLASGDHVRLCKVCAVVSHGDVMAPIY